MRTGYFTQCKTLDKAKKLYYKLALELHPDKGGETADFQAMLNQFHAFRPTEEKYQGEAAEWNSRAYSSIVNDLLNIPGIIVAICGSWIWLQGDTKPVKEQIKAIDCGDFMKRGFSRNKLQWYFSPVGYRKSSNKKMSFGQIASLYGYERATRPDDSEDTGRKQIN